MQLFQLLLKEWTEHDDNFLIEDGDVDQENLIQKKVLIFLEWKGSLVSICSDSSDRNQLDIVACGKPR